MMHKNEEDDKDKAPGSSKSPDFDFLDFLESLHSGQDSKQNKQWKGGDDFYFSDPVYVEPDIDDETAAKIEELSIIAKELDKRLLKSTQSDEDEKGLKINYVSSLNPSQLAAVKHNQGPLLVIAGAGSGKTRVITYKVAWLLEHSIPADQILLLTFTRKAAREMLDRVQSLLTDYPIQKINGGTFHAFANRVLRQYAKVIGINPNFSIIDPEDSADIIDLLKNELKISGKKKGFPFPKKSKIQDIFSRSKNLQLSIEDVVFKFFEESEPYLDELNMLYHAMNRYKKASHVLDYDDLMNALRDALKTHPAFRKKLNQQFKYVLVDEFQDTNTVQREILEMICGKNGNLCAVGDDTQSIYAFRGANYENILRFPQFFPDAQVVKIEQNYRSDQSILDFTNEVITHARLGFKKKLFTKASEGTKPLVQRFADELEEAEFIANTIVDGIDKQMKFSDFAILVRAAWHSNYIQTELTKRNIPFVVVGGIKFSERRHVKDIVSFLKLIVNPLDAVAWHRILQLIDGVGKVRSKEIITYIHQGGDLLLFEPFSQKKFYSELKELGRQMHKAATELRSPAAICSSFIEFYKPILQQLEDDFAVRYRDLEVFVTIAEKYDNLEKFLSDFTIDPPSNKYQDSSQPILNDDNDVVTISTIHSAKGLEWQCVFVPFCLDGLFPGSRSLGSIYELEEERRLFYVACSRAMKFLYLTMPSYVQTWDATFTHTSRFIAEMDSGKYQQNTMEY